MTCDTLIAGVPCRFLNFGSEQVFSSWSWKLDPWRLPLFKNADYDLIIQGHTQDFSGGSDSLTPVCEEFTGFFKRQISVLPEGGALWDFLVARNGELILRLHTDPDWKQVTLLTDNTGTGGQTAFEYLAQITPLLGLKRGFLTLHAALVEYKGCGLAICAPSGVGKTTHARLWREHKQALILNGDRTVCRPADDGWLSWGTPWSGTSGEQINRCVPLKALVVLEHGEINSARQMTPQEALPLLFPHLLYPRWEPELTAGAMKLLDRLLTEIPVFRLLCRPDVESTDVLLQAVSEVLL